MSEKQSKLEKIFQILSGKVKNASPIIDRSALAVIAERDLPGVAKQNLQFSLGLLMLAAAWICQLAFEQLPNEINFANWAVPSLWVLSCTLFISAKLSARKDLTLAIEMTERPLEELEQLEDYLYRYIENMNRRTSRYFHCVTNTKVTNYFIIIQLKNSLTEKLLEIKARLESGKRRDVFEAIELLKGSLMFTDGATLDSGQLHVVPLARLATTASLLVENLENGLTELESEIHLVRGEVSHEKVKF